MKRFFALIFALLILAGTVLPTFAAPFLGEAAAVLSSEMTLLKSSRPGKKICFCEADFKQAMGVPTFTSVTVTSLPDAEDGTLLFAGRKVKEGQTVKRKNVSSLCFVPSSDKVEAASFRFTSKGLLGGAEMTAILRFSDGNNNAPVIDGKGSLSVRTQGGISFFGNLPASDPDGDRIEFITVSAPENGSLTFTDRSEGAFRYTPSPSFTGKDRFSYVVRDEFGNYSLPQTVNVKVTERLGNVTFVDMEEHPAYNAAVVLCAAGVLDGKKVGDDCYFLPEECVTRAEFVTMALKTAGIRADSTLGSTFFDDNAAIPKSLVGYVATAQRLGIATGTFDGKALNFRPNDPITRSEAAMILSSLLPDGSGAQTAAISDRNSVPSYARSAVDRCLNAGVMEKQGDSFLADVPVTRGEAARSLFRLSEIA